MERIVIFGASGDLAARYLMPALAKLYEADKLPPGIKITGVDRQEWDDEHGFRRLVLDNLEHYALRDRKMDVLRAIRRLSPEEAQRQSVRARYDGAGKVGQRHIPAYADEEGVDPDRGTETFAQVTLMIDNLRWAGGRADTGCLGEGSGAAPRVPAGSDGHSVASLPPERVGDESRNMPGPWTR